jgi:hypothetical protein
MTQMEVSTIFYSWQSEDKKTKNFIDKALKGAIEDIKASSTFSTPLILDRDTKDVIGSPHIVKTILSKIDACEIFVADISIIDTAGSGKKLVNQNVMFELGYAMAKHTELRVVSLFNEDSGDIKDVPFDISHHRAHPFSMTSDIKGAQLRKDLYHILLKHLTADREQLIPGHEDNLYAKLKKDVVNFLLSDPAKEDGAALRANGSLDEAERLIMKVFASMPDEKRIMVVRTLGGGVLIPSGKLNEAIQKEIDNVDTQEIIADMDSLVDGGVLSISYSQKGTPSYRPTKQGFEIIKNLQS